MKIIDSIEALKSAGRFYSWHTKMWKTKNVRPATNSDDPRNCNTKYCQYDEPHKDYIYTDAWKELLNKELKKIKETAPTRA